MLNLGHLKQLASILLLGILLFNWFGYRLVAGYFENRAAVQLEAALDSHQYNEADLLTIKVPANLPYYNNDSRFERVDGEIDVYGVHYKYVARRIYNDSIELRCIPNQAKIHIRNARDEFFKLAYDLQQTPAGKKQDTNNSAAIKLMVVAYFETHSNWSLAPLQAQKNVLAAGYSSSLTSCCLPVADPPPDAA